MGDGCGKVEPTRQGGTGQRMACGSSKMSNKKKVDAAVHRAAANSPRRSSGGAHYRRARETAQCELEKLVGGAAKNEDNSAKSVSASVNVVVVGYP